MKLTSGSVAPGQGTTTTKFTFSVTYTDNDGCVPDRIVAVVIGVRTISLSYVSGGLQTGATFARTVTLPAGTWDYRFEATSGSGAGRRQAKLTTVTPANVSVHDVAPAPTPKPIPTVAPTARVTPAPTKPPPTPRPSTTPPATPDEATPVPTAAWTPVPTIAPTQAPVVPATTQPAPGQPLALSKLFVAIVATVGGLLLFGLLAGRWLRSTLPMALPPVPRRRRDDPSTEPEPIT